MKILIKWLCMLYFTLHEESRGLVFYDDDIGGIRIEFEPKETEDEI